MKLTLWISSLVLVAQSAFGAEVEADLNEASARPVAKYTVISGFTGTRNEIVLHENGLVVQNFDVRGEKKQRNLTVLSPERMQEILPEIEAIAPRGFVVENPTAPFCFDAPTIIYSVIKADGTMLDISKTANCRKTVLVGSGIADKEIVASFIPIIEMASHTPW